MKHLTFVGKRKRASAEAYTIWLDDFRYKPVMAPDDLGRYSVYDCDREDIIDREATARHAEIMAILMNIRAILEIEYR